MEEQNNVNMGSVPSGGSAGLIIGAIVILAIIILGGLYFWRERTDDMMTNEAIDSINMQSDSDDTTSIEADLNTTDVDSLDAELNAS